MISCRISSQEKTDEFKNVVEVILPTVEGEVAILPNHCEYFTILKMGEIKLFTSTNNLKKIQIKSGEVRVNNNEVVVVVDLVKN